jgi:hypothetical protein
MNEYYMAHIGEDKYKLHVSKESGSLTKNKKGIVQREVGNPLKLKCKASCDY